MNISDSWDFADDKTLVDASLFFFPPSTKWRNPCATLSWLELRTNSCVQTQFVWGTEFVLKYRLSTCYNGTTEFRRLVCINLFSNKSLGEIGNGPSHFYAPASRYHHVLSFFARRTKCSQSMSSPAWVRWAFHSFLMEDTLAALKLLNMSSP